MFLYKCTVVVVVVVVVVFFFMHWSQLTCITIHFLLLTSVLCPTGPPITGLVPALSTKSCVSDTMSPVFRYKHSSPWKKRCSWLLCSKRETINFFFFFIFLIGGEGRSTLVSYQYVLGLSPTHVAMLYSLRLLLVLIFLLGFVLGFVRFPHSTNPPLLI